MAEKPKGIRAALVEVQAGLSVPKSQKNDYGGYNYRSKEDILTAAKPLCHERGLSIVVLDEVVFIEGRFYVESTAIITDAAGNSISTKAQAREPESRKGMDASQITGTAASYAGKRALGNLLAVDDTADADSMRPEAKDPPVRKQQPVREKQQPAKDAQRDYTRLSELKERYAKATGRSLQEAAAGVMEIAGGQRLQDMTDHEYKAFEMKVTKAVVVLEQASGDE